MWTVSLDEQASFAHYRKCINMSEVASILTKKGNVEQADLLSRIF